MQWLQHMGKHFSSSLTYSLCYMLSLSNLHTNVVCVLVYIPSLVGIAFILAGIKRKGYPRDVSRGYSLQNDSTFSFYLPQITQQ